MVLDRNSAGLAPVRRESRAAAYAVSVGLGFLASAIAMCALFLEIAFGAAVAIVILLTLVPGFNESFGTVLFVWLILWLLFTIGGAVALGRALGASMNVPSWLPTLGAFTAPVALAALIGTGAGSAALTIVEEIDRLVDPFSPI